MSEAARELILKRLRVYSTPPAQREDRRIVADRRTRSIQVQVERRSGMERRVRAQLIQYLQLRNISYQMIPD